MFVPLWSRKAKVAACVDTTGLGFGFGVTSARQPTKISPIKLITTGITNTDRLSLATPLSTRIVIVNPAGVIPGIGGIINIKRSSNEHESICARRTVTLV